MMSSKNPRLTGNRTLTVKQHNLVLHSLKHINIFKLLQHQANVRKYYKMKTNCVPQSPRYGSLVMLLKFVLAAKRI